MSQIVQAKCPHCNNTIRIPSNWMGQWMKCKFCASTFQAQPKHPVSKPAPVAKAKPAPVARAKPAPVAKAKPAPVARAKAAPVAATPVKARAATPAPQPTQAVQSFPVATPQTDNSFAFNQLQDAPASNGRVPYSQRRKKSPWKGALIGLGFLVFAAVLVFAGPQLADILSNLNHNSAASNDTDKDKKVAENNKGNNRTPHNSEKNSNNVNDPTGTVLSPLKPRKIDPNRPPAPGKGHPRRALCISVNDYLYSNPLHYGRPPSQRFAGSRTKDILDWGLSRFLNFHKNQCFELTDYPHPGKEDAPAPMKVVIEETIMDFLQTSRNQDRILLMFSGHVVESEERKEAYLVPIEGDTDEIYLPIEERKTLKTLIPLSWVFEQLAVCPARQKILVLDVCRSNTGRGEERPGSDVMGEVLDKMLIEPPKGVQVWSSCIKEQHSYEFESGSVFQQAFCLTMNNLKMIQNPDDLIPLELIVPKVNDILAKALEPLDLKQTTRLTGNAPKSGAKYDEAEAMPPTVVMRAPPVPGGAAAKTVVQSILNEINSAPPPRAGRAGIQDKIRFTVLPPFRDDVLKEFIKDGYINEEEFLKPDMAKKYPLRAAVVRAKKALQQSTSKLRMREKFLQTANGNIKDAIREEQKIPGKAIFILEDETLENLMAAEEYLEKEKSMRWKAHYYYVMARLKSRLIFLYEYNYLLANIRSDELPELTNGATGYRVGSVKKTNIREGVVREWTRQLRRGEWDFIIEEFAGTPWAILARREKRTHLGLEWRAYVE